MSSVLKYRFQLPSFLPSLPPSFLPSFLPCWGPRIPIRRPLGEGRRSARLIAEAWTSNATLQRDGRAATRETQHAPARARRFTNRRSCPVVHLFSGADPSVWTKENWGSYQCICVDTAMGSQFNIHHPGVWAYLWKLAEGGYIKAVIDPGVSVEEMMSGGTWITWIPSSWSLSAATAILRQIWGVATSCKADMI